jgi:hypothetical protein
MEATNREGMVAAVTDRWPSDLVRSLEVATSYEPPAIEQLGSLSELTLHSWHHHHFHHHRGSI